MGAGQHTMRKLRLKDIIKKRVKFVAIRLRQGSGLNGCLNLGSGQSSKIIEGVQLDLCKKRRCMGILRLCNDSQDLSTKFGGAQYKKGKKKPTPKSKECRRIKHTMRKLKQRYN